MYPSLDSTNDNRELFTKVPEVLKDWVVAHVPPQTVLASYGSVYGSAYASAYSNLGSCSLSQANGIPIAHVPVKTLTADALTTSTIKGNFASVTAPPISVTDMTTTSPSSQTTTSPVCCYIDAPFSVHKILWYTGNVEVIVATVSTIVYQYKDTVTTAYSTIFNNNTLPTQVISRPPGSLETSIAFPGLPNDIIDVIDGYYVTTSLVAGTVFTDPYGVEYTSPTPVWYYSSVRYYTAEPTLSGSMPTCPPPIQNPSDNNLAVWPSVSNCS